MSGINTLSDIYRQKGDAFLRQLLGNYVIINRQSNGSFFGMSVGRDGVPKFYKKGGEISLIDRILMKYYEHAISQMQRLPAETLSAIPDNLLFGMDYHNDGEPSLDGAPKSYLTLSYVKIIDTAGMHKYVHEKETLDKWAKILCVEPPPILFAGKLSDEQKTKMLDFVYTPSEQLVAKFRSNSFTRYILDTLCSDAQQDSAEEIVFRFYADGTDDDAMAVAKLIDPVIAEFSTAAPDNKVPDDYLYLIIIDLMNFIEMYSLKDLMSVIDRKKSFEENYVSLVDKIYLEFVDKFKYKYADVKLRLPDFMRRPDFDINMDMVRSEEVKRIVNANDTFREIYKILLNFFRKKKNKPIGLFNSSLVLHFNKLVDKIKNVVIGDNVSESYFPSFYQFTGSISEEFDNMSALSVKQRYNAYKKSKKVNIIVDYFQPVTNDHIAAAKLMHGKNGLPVVMVMLVPRQKCARLPFRPNTVKRAMQLVRSEFGEIIIDVVEIRTNSVDSVVSALHPKYQPILWGTSKNRLNDYLLQMDFAKNKRIVYNVSKNMKLIELPIGVNCERVIDMIRGEKFQQYKEYVPKSIHSEFFNLRTEIAE